MPVDRGKPRLFHRATEWTVFNPECMEDFFHGQRERIWDSCSDDWVRTKAEGSANFS